MFIKILCFLIFLSICLTQSLGQTCDEKGRVRIDNTYAKLLTLGGSGRKFPEEQGQLKKYCDDSAKMIKEADNYKNKCLKQMPKQVTGVLVYSVRNLINRNCNKVKATKHSQDFLDSTPCANGAKVQIDKCYTTLIDKMLGANNAEAKMKIPHICCDSFNLLGCVEKSLLNTKCNEKRTEFFTNWVRELFGNVVDLLCGEYTENSDKCEKMAPTPKKKGQKRTKSFMIPLIDAITSLPEA